jgi:hypothetical protein
LRERSDARTCSRTIFFNIAWAEARLEPNQVIFRRIYQGLAFSE